NTLAKGLDLDWDSQLYPSRVSVSEGFQKRSNARLEKACAVIDRIFAGHPEEGEEAKHVAKEILEQARAAA
ncbi:MAG: hypothetical protein WBP79_16465, partial [Candidatus Acidiferrales bacterium]